MYQVTIQNVPPMVALTCEHTGPYMQIGKAFDELNKWFREHDALPAKPRLIALYYDDPASVPEEKLRSAAGIVISGNETISTPFARTEIRGGTHAVLQHKGPYSGLANAYNWLYREWLPQSGREAAERPVFEEYLNTPGDTPAADLLTNIFLPLR